MQYISYQVLGRGNIVLANTTEIPNHSNYQILFSSSFAMVPKAQFVVYFIHNGEIVSDHLEIEFENDLQNFVCRTVD